MRGSLYTEGAQVGDVVPFRNQRRAMGHAVRFVGEDADCFAAAWERKRYCKACDSYGVTCRMAVKGGRRLRWGVCQVCWRFLTS